MQNRQANASQMQLGATKLVNISKPNVMPMHRRSNTAATFVPTMTLKQFQESKTAREMLESICNSGVNSNLQEKQSINLAAPAMP